MDAKVFALRRRYIESSLICIQPLSRQSFGLFTLARRLLGCMTLSRWVPHVTARRKLRSGDVASAWQRSSIRCNIIAVSKSDNKAS